MSEKIRIGMIGAGDTGTPLLKQLLAADFVEVLALADLEAQAPGMQIAAAHGVTTTADLMDLIRLGTQIDILIDASGSTSVLEKLRSSLQDSGNHHTVIMHERILMLMMSLSQGRLVSMKHGQVEYS